MKMMKETILLRRGVGFGFFDLWVLLSKGTPLLFICHQTMN
jgi:hypothetical protein